MRYRVKSEENPNYLNLLCGTDNRQENHGAERSNEKGAALVTTLLIMMLLLGFVALALSRTSVDNMSATNDAAEADAFGASQAGLEDSTRDFATVLEQKLSPGTSDITRIKNGAVPGFSDSYIYKKDLKMVGDSKLVTLTSGEFQGLYSMRDEWQIDVTAKQKNSDAEVSLMRRFYNNRIPLFQFGAFYNDDLELNRPPLFTFGGKVHTNGNLFLSSYKGEGVYFKSKITVVGEVVNDIWKTNTNLADNVDNKNEVFVPNTAENMVELETGSGSVTCSSASGTGVLVDPQGTNFPYPKCTKNTSWSSYSNRFEGNLKANTAKLKLPVDRLGLDLIEMIRRGKNTKDKANIGGTVTSVSSSTQDGAILSKERFANKPGLRISLADSRDKLPQCDGVATSTACGVQLNQSVGSSLGYQPVAMEDSLTYKTTALNANRMVADGRDLWIKVEMVRYDNDNNVPVVEDVTEDFLSLGVTQEIGRRDPSDNYSLSSTDFKIPLYAATDYDSRSIIKLQRFYIDNKTGDKAPIPNDTSTKYVTSVNPSSSAYYYSFPASQTATVTPTSTGGLLGALLTTLLNNALSDCTNILGSGTVSLLPSAGSGKYNKCVSNPVANYSFAKPIFTDSSVSFNSDESAHYKTALIDTTFYRVVPFPIQMYDAREGNRYDKNNGLSGDKLYRNGVMSLVDIDLYNLRRFFKGDFDSVMPKTTPYAKAHSNKGLKSTDVPESRGWVVYFSDRRGDSNFDGRYDFEKVIPQYGTDLAQDLNKNGNVGEPDNSTGQPQENKNAYKESPYPIDDGVDIGLAAVTDHQYYRRGVRLINAREVPGKYDSTTPANTKGFTFASENGIYVSGNYNVQSVTLAGGTKVAESPAYSPQDSVPSALVGDAVTILSNSWSDANSFIYPFDQTKRDASPTQVRFAMISGDSQTYRPTSAQSNGSFTGLNGGIHNFKRFLEDWTNVRLNYAGSLINLYNAYNNNGRWKCCDSVYHPPDRDWTFDSTFTDPDRLPPGSPYVYYLRFTGFQRVN